MTRSLQVLSHLLQTLDNLFFYFGEVPDDDSQVPLQRIENALGHFLHFTRTAQGTLTDISATGGTRVHLHHDNPLATAPHALSQI